MPVPPDDERRNQRDQNQLPRVRVFVERPRQQRESGGGGDGPERDVAEGNGEDHELDVVGVATNSPNEEEDGFKEF